MTRRQSPIRSIRVLAVVVAATALIPAAAVADPLPAEGSTADTGSWLGPDGQPLPFASDDEVLKFLRTAEIMEMHRVSTGINRPWKVLLASNGIRAHAIFRTVNIERSKGPQRKKKAYMDFRDKAVYECAAYRLSRLLGLNRVPPAVSRRINAQDGSLQLWVEQTVMAVDHYRRGSRPPDPRAWHRQLQTMDLFDNLVGNPDRNMGNMLVDRRWRLWLVDHSRAFVKSSAPLEVDRVHTCERSLWHRLQELDDNELRTTLEPWLSPFEIETLLRRRARLVEHIRRLMDEHGEDRVLFDMPARAAGYPAET